MDLPVKKVGSILRKATQAPGLTSLFQGLRSIMRCFMSPSHEKRWRICLWLDTEKACNGIFVRSLDLFSCWASSRPARATGKRRRFRLMLPPYLLFPMQEYVEFCGKDSSFSWGFFLSWPTNSSKSRITSVFKHPADRHIIIIDNDVENPLFFILHVLCLYVWGYDRPKYLSLHTLSGLA